MSNKKIAVITGVNGGIGSVLAKELAKEYDVIGIDQQLRTEYEMLEYICVDFNFISSTSTVNSIVDTIKKWHGGVDLLINNAAIQIKKDFGSFSYEDMERNFNVNLIAPMILTQSLMRLFNDASNIINIGSIHSSQTKRGFSIYATSKGGLETFTKAMSVELAPKTRTNMIKPAAINTPMLEAGLSYDEYNELSSYHPTGDVGHPEEIANLVKTICDTPFINGSVIEINGGICNVLRDPETKIE